jgi:hypothetical protein
MGTSTVTNQINDLITRLEEFNAFLPTQALYDFDGTTTNMAKIDAALNEVNKLRSQVKYKDVAYVLDNLLPALTILRQVVTMWSTMADDIMKAKIEKAHAFLNAIREHGVTREAIAEYPSTYNREDETAKAELMRAYRDGDINMDGDDAEAKLGSARAELERIQRNVGDAILSVQKGDLRTLNADDPRVKDVADETQALMQPSIRKALASGKGVDVSDRVDVTLIAVADSDAPAPYVFRVDSAIVQTSKDNGQKIYRCWVSVDSPDSPDGGQIGRGPGSDFSGGGLLLTNSTEGQAESKVRTNAAGSTTEGTSGASTLSLIGNTEKSSTSLAKHIEQEIYGNESSSGASAPVSSNDNNNKESSKGKNVHCTTCHEDDIIIDSPCTLTSGFIRIPFATLESYGWIRKEKYKSETAEGYDWFVEKAATSAGTIELDNGKLTVRFVVPRYQFQPIKNEDKPNLASRIREKLSSAKTFLSSLIPGWKDTPNVDLPQLFSELGIQPDPDRLNGHLIDTETKKVYYLPFQSIDVGGLKHILVQDFSGQYSVIEYVMRRGGERTLRPGENVWIPGNHMDCMVAHCHDTALIDSRSAVTSVVLKDRSMNQVTVQTGSGLANYTVIGRPLRPDAVCAIYLVQHQTLCLYIPSPATVAANLMILQTRPAVGLSVGPVQPDEKQFSIDGSPRAHAMRLLSRPGGNVEARKALLQLCGVHILMQSILSALDEGRIKDADQLLRASKHSVAVRLVAKAKKMVRLRQAIESGYDPSKEPSGKSIDVENLASFFIQLQKIDAKDVLFDLTGIDLSDPKWHLLTTDATRLKDLATSYDQLLAFIHDRSHVYQAEVKGTIDGLKLITSDNQLRSMLESMEEIGDRPESSPSSTDKYDARRKDLEWYKMSVIRQLVQAKAMFGIVRDADGTVPTKCDTAIAAAAAAAASGTSVKSSNILMRMDAAFRNEIDEQLPGFLKQLKKTADATDARAKAALAELDLIEQRMGGPKGLIKAANQKIAEAAGDREVQQRFINYKVRKVHSFLAQAQGACKDFALMHVNFVMRKFRTPIRIINGLSPKHPQYKEFQSAIGVIIQKIEKFAFEFDRKMSNLFTGNMTIREHLGEFEEPPLLEAFAKATESCSATLENIPRFYRNKFSLFEMIMDSQFSLMYFLKLLRFAFVWMALFLAGSIFTNRYVELVFNQKVAPPPLTMLVGLFIAIDMGLNIILLSILSLIKRIYAGTHGFIVDDTLIKRFMIDYAMSTALIAVMSFTVAEVIRKRSVFKYDSDVAPIKAFKDILLAMSGFVVIIPFFLFAD